jgi:Ala-tRNA(Pro) deacylase
MRIDNFLADEQVDCEILMHPPAYTAQKRAKYLHVSGAQVAKSVLLHGPGGYVLAVLPATRQIDLDRLAAALGGPVRLAKTAEVADVFLDCEWGVASAFGRTYGVPTLLEDGVAPDAWLVLEAQSRAEAVRMRCRDYERLEQPRRLRFARAAPRAREER